jgi:hypothetical protein
LQSRSHTDPEVLTKSRSRTNRKKLKCQSCWALLSATVHLGRFKVEIKVKIWQINTQVLAEPDRSQTGKTLFTILNKFRVAWALADVKEEYRKDGEIKFSRLLARVSKDDLNGFLSDKGMTLLQEAVSINGALCFTKALLDAGANPNGCEKMLKENKCPPVLLAARRAEKGWLTLEPCELRDTLKLLLVHGADFAVKDSKHNTILHILLKKRFSDVGKEVWSFVMGHEFGSKKPNDAEWTYNSVRYFLLRKMLQKIANKRNIDKKAPLGIAMELDWPDEMDGDVVKWLLSLGAYAGMDKVPSCIMEDFLNGQHNLTTESNPGQNTFRPITDFNSYSYDSGAAPEKYKVSSVTHHESKNDLKIDFDYSFLFSYTGDSNAAGAEMQWLSAMAQSKKHRNHLRNPVLKSFLLLKWKMVEPYFNLNLCLYVHFTFLLTWFLFKKFGLSVHTDGTHYRDVWSILHWILTCLTSVMLLVGHNVRTLLSLCKVSFKVNWNHKLLRRMIPSPIVIIAIGSTIAISYFGSRHSTNPINNLYSTLVILLALLAVRELFQFGVSPSQYVCSYEYYVELTILTLLGLILFSSIDKGTLRVLAAHALVLSWAELLLLTGKHPKFSQLNLSMTMFVSVVHSYVYFLLWYILLIISFGFGFHIMLYDPDAKRSDNETMFFQHPFLSVVKTTTMMIGELDVSNLDLQDGNPKGYLSFVFLLIFVFVVVIILMNLLNALAVREIGEMEVTAETLSYVARVETVLFMETVQLLIHKCIKYKREHWIHTVWHCLTNIKGTRIKDTDKFPRWSMRIQNRDVIHH